MARCILAAVAAAAVVASAAGQQPDQAHIALTGKPGEISIDFVSHQPNCSGFGVQYGLSPDKLAFVPSYNCSNFTTNSPSTAWQNQVLLTGLTPNTTYYYIAGSVDFREPWSQVYSFRYQPAREGGPIFAIFADFGFYNDESLEAMLTDAFEGNIDYVLHAGDFAYNMEDNKGEIGDSFMRSIEPMVSRMPYMVSPGNHEDMGGQYTQYKRRFASIADNAGKNSGSNSNMWYSFDVTDPTTSLTTHFIAWDTEAWWSQTPAEQAAQLAWLKADLAAVDRTATPWVVSYAHKAWYMDDTIQPPNGAGAEVWTLMHEGGVDLFFCGHVHEYRRFLPVDPVSGATDGNCTDKAAAVYSNPAFFVPIVTGAPGCQEVNAHHDMPRVAGGLTVDSVTSTNNYGFGKLQIVNATAAHWTWTTAVPHVNSTDPAYSDDLWIIQTNHGRRPPPAGAARSVFA